MELLLDIMNMVYDTPPKFPKCLWGTLSNGVVVCFLPHTGYNNGIKQYSVIAYNRVFPIYDYNEFSIEQLKGTPLDKELKDLVKELEIIEDKRSWVYMTNNGPFKLLSEV